MATGIVEYAVAEFPGDEFTGTIAPTLKDLVDRRLIKIIDLAFVRKEADGTVETVEFDTLPPAVATLFDDVDGEVSGLVSEADIQALAASLTPDSSSAILVWENLWSAELAEAVRASKGRLAAHGTVSPEQLAAAQAATRGE
jgi:hypothetical protein